MRFQPFARACYPRDQYLRMVQLKIRPQRQTGTFYILRLRDFEILGGRSVKRDEGARLILLAAYSASGHLSPWLTADSPRKVSIGPSSLHQSG